MEGCIRALMSLAAVIIAGCRSDEVSYGRSSLNPHPIDSDNTRASFQRNAGLFAIAREGCLSGLQRGS